LRDRLPPIGSDPLDVLDGFATWAQESGRPLYPHQEEAGLALADLQHVVLATPTGSGKSMAALCGIVLALNRGERAVWTAPIKALVAEKFFELIDLLGPTMVGLAIGDASINRDAPVLVCTAEVLANNALSATDSGVSPFGFACLDEFHYYGDNDRGWAWQVPLLLLPTCQFLMASATLGDVTRISEDLAERSGKAVTKITGVTRPIPLYHQFRTTSVAESVQAAIEQGLFPVYLVHTSQADAIERASGLVSLPLTSRAQREAIAEAIGKEKLNTGFGQNLGRYLRNGVGVHHAGMLPRYRRLVEKLAAEGLLPVICGTDTLGVGINIPIRTVLFSALTKYDGTKVRTLRAREFHQLAGRAGRPGFDPDGHVWAQAPEHVIDNDRALARAGDDAKARRKVKRAEAPKGFVHWDEKTFERLIVAEPEALASRFKVTADMVASVLSRPNGADVLKNLLTTNHDTDTRKRTHKRRAIHIYRSLETAGVAERLRTEDGTCAGVRIGSLIENSKDVERVRFTSPLGPFAIEVVSSLERDTVLYPLDVVSVIESVIDNPMAILIAQEKQARSQEIARLKSEGVEYEERMALLQEVTWPKPLAEDLRTMFLIYKQAHPWTETWPEPKSIVRELLETGETFSSYIKRYGLERSEGLLLRHLTDVWRALDKSLPLDAYTDEVEDVIDWLSALIRSIDASLLEEWERLAGLVPADRDAPKAPLSMADSGPPKAWKTAIRTAVFGWVELLAIRRHDRLADRCGWTMAQLSDAMRAYWDEFDGIGTDNDARSTSYFSLAELEDKWVITQRIADPLEDGSWRLTIEMGIAESIEAGSPMLKLTALDALR
jgi:Domain of unknown function (DUF3516)/DEAD/DEAH box helicase